MNKIKSKLIPILKVKLGPMLNDKNDARKNDVWRIILFGLNKSAGVALMVLMGRWMYFTQNVLQLGAFLAVAVLPMTIVDAITDPIVANWFDKFESKYGKYRPVMFAGYMLTVIPVLVIFLYPVNPNMPFWISYTILLAMNLTVVLGNTLRMTATRAGQAIITQAPEQRPVYAIGVTLFDGMIMGLFSILIDSDLVGNIQEPFVWRFSVIFLAALSFVLLIIAMKAIETRDKPKYYSYTKRKEKPKITEFLTVIKRNKALQKLLWASASDRLAAGIRNSLTIYLFANIIMQRSLIAAVDIIAGIGLGFPAILIGVYLASKKGSANIYRKISIIQILVALLGFTMVLSLLPADPAYTYSGLGFKVLLVCLIYGLYTNTLGVSSNLVTAMVGDIADYEYTLSGKFIPGTIAASISFVEKIIGSFLGLIIFGVMMFSGFRGIGKEAVVPENVFINYRFYYSVLVCVFLLPALGHLITYLAMRNYPIFSDNMNKISLKMAEERRLNEIEQNTINEAN